MESYRSVDIALEHKTYENWKLLKEISNKKNVWCKIAYTGNMYCLLVFLNQIVQNCCINV